MTRITATIILFFTMMLLASCGGENKAEQSDPASDANLHQSDSVSSEFIFSAYDIDGSLRSSGEWVGKQPVVINFWGTWCPPCRKEIPDLVRIYNEYQSRGIEILGVAVRDQAGSVAKFSYENGMNWVMLMGDNSLAMRYGITGVPTTIFVDGGGNEKGRFVGPRDYETFKQAFEMLLQP
ncbi:MAG: TlpA family protein disulfide reductase [Candidatus Zixiibacteriota bacterium]|nr:MAG: TlpA family protein disulfide reductase [candidate division Zixibacteria bacterium]